MAENDHNRTDPAGYPTLEEKEDVYHTNLKAKYITGIVTSDGTYSVGTMGAISKAGDATGSAVTYGSKNSVAEGNVPSRLPVDRTWKIKDDDGNEWYIPLFRYG